MSTGLLSALYCVHVPDKQTGKVLHAAIHQCIQTSFHLKLDLKNGFKGASTSLNKSHITHICCKDQEVTSSVRYHNHS